MKKPSLLILGGFLAAMAFDVACPYHDLEAQSIYKAAPLRITGVVKPAVTLDPGLAWEVNRTKFVVPHNSDMAKYFEVNQGRQVTLTLTY